MSDGLREALVALTYASDDGTEYEHNGHGPNEGEPECPGCWVEMIRAALLANPPQDAGEGLDEARVAAVCSQCGELPSVMVEIGTSDGWCEDCLDHAAYPPHDTRKVLLWAADEMAAVIADGDVAECAAPVEGEVGRSACVDRRDGLYEEPVEWLRTLAAAIVADQP